MSKLFHLLTRPRGLLAEIAPHRVVLEVWQLEDRVLLAGGLLSEAPIIDVPIQALSLPAGAMALPFVAAAPLAGAPPVVRFNSPLTGVRQFSFVPYDVNFTGGVRLAVADVTGDGVPDLITGAGPGGASHVRVMDGRSGGQAEGPLGSFLAFESDFTGGVRVAAMDVNRDGFADVIVAAGIGGGPRVRVLSGADGSVLRDFFAADASLRQGLAVAIADVDRDGQADIVTAAGGDTQVQAFSGGDLSRLASIVAFDSGDALGVSIAAGDVTGDGAAEIVVGSDIGGAPRIRVFDLSGVLLKDFFAFDAAFRGGVSVATSDVDGDGRAEIIAGAGPAGGSRVRIFDGLSLDEMNSYAAYSAPYDNTGVVVAGR